MKLYIIGCGPGAEKYLTLEAREAIQKAGLVIATGRLYESLGQLNPSSISCTLGEIPEAISRSEPVERVAVLVSGDSGFFSLGKSLPEQLKELPELEVVYLCGTSSLQYLAARLGLNYEDARPISLHGRSGSIVPLVCYNAKVFALTGGELRAHDLIKDLCEAGLGGTKVMVGENLGSDRERIVSGTALSLKDQRFEDLACMFALNENPVNPSQHIGDADFTRGGVPMTKQAVRTLAIAALNIQPGDTVADIGAGTGSVAVEMARKANAGFVYAVERNEEALALLAQNREKFGAFNLRIVPSDAPAGLERLPALDKVFIGGSGGKLAEIFQAVLQKNGSAHIAVTAITLETLHEAVSVFERHGLKPEISCINAAVAHKVGGYNMMKAENPVYIITGGKSAA